MISDVTGILLAGGQSRRMGKDKRFLLVGDRTLFERSLTILRSLFSHVCIIIGADSPNLETTVPVIRDLVPNRGSLGGIYTGLKQSLTPYVFVVACDMPFLNPTLIRYMVSVKDESDLVIARSTSGVQPTHALYSRRCLPTIEAMVNTGQLRIRDLLEATSLHVRFIDQNELRNSDPDGRSFLNVNTPAELADAERIAADNHGTPP